MKVKIGQLRQLVKEELSRLHEVGEVPGDPAAPPEVKPEVNKKDKKILDLLSGAFTTRVDLEDVRYIRYKVLKNLVSLIDVGEQLGHMQTSASSQELANAKMTPAQLGDWLAKNGARPQQTVRRKKSPFSGPMGGYD